MNNKLTLIQFTIEKVYVFDSIDTLVLVHIVCDRTPYKECDINTNLIYYRKYLCIENHWHISNC